MSAYSREAVIIWGILIFSSTVTGQTCRGKCGRVLEACSCRAACLSLLNCCTDYSQSCFQASPHSSSMLGGRALRILGLDLPSDGLLVCRFKGEVELKGFVDEGGRAYCTTPLMFETGWIPFDVSTDGAHFDRAGEYLSVHPGSADPHFEVTLVNSTQWDNYGRPNAAGRLHMTWIRSFIPAEKVNVELWGYREVSRSEAGTSVLRAELSFLYSLGRNLNNSGVFSFTPEPKENVSEWELGNIRITAGSRSEGERNVQGLWSRGHILTWHLEAFRDDSSAWARSGCLQWDAAEKKRTDFLDELVDCPCTLAQAQADTGRFRTDSTCDTESGSACTFHPDCVHFVRAVQASPSQGSGQQCCYDSFGSLVLTGDSVGGSTPGRAHDWGAPPYKDPPRIPGYSHWLYDVTSFFRCCVWSDLCHVYFNHRPSSGCRKYQPPRAGVVFGNLHFITLDGLSYTFNGKGEYYLVSSADKELSVQARTEQVKLENGTFVKAAQLSSVAMKANSSDVIEVRAAGEHLQVLRNQKVLPFTEQRWMDLHGVFVFAPSRQNVTVIFSCGAAAELRLNEGAMTATVLLPAQFSNRTQGLLGSMNSDPSDDLMTSFQKVISSANATPEEIFTFGAGWSISKTSSLFTYDSPNLLDSYFVPPSHDPAFVPAFSLPEKPDDPLVADMMSVCLGEGAQFCKHDTLISGSLAVGNATLRAHRSHRALMEALEPVVSCGWIPSPRNGKKNGTRYLQGDTLSFSCSEGYTLYGSPERTCVQDGSWTGEQTHCITDDYAAFVLGAVGSISALVTMGVLIELHNRKLNRLRKTEPHEMLTQARAR
ncbi:sushi domain-containing protein 2 [Nematolebias whitei]|uniref:sushi domain-containing protein 2 n=1 Tax=Nematolebias whitei TaxID=451745 RepID=UPI001898E7F8|nr:sushi domain-containing protein 2 [Nematolebias whitei]